MSIYSWSSKPVLRRLIEFTQFTSWAFTENVRRLGLVSSMGTVGNCYDNAPMESFWGSMQVELLYVASGTDLLDDHRAELRCIRVRHGFPFGQPPFSQRKVKFRGTHQFLMRAPGRVDAPHRLPAGHRCHPLAQRPVSLNE